MPSPLLSFHSAYLNRFARSDEEIAAKAHYNVLVEAQAQLTGLRARLKDLVAKADAPTVEAVQELLDGLDDVEHDTIEASVHVAANAVQDFANEREAREADGERSSLMLRQVGR